MKVGISKVEGRNARVRPISAVGPDSEVSDDASLSRQRMLTAKIRAARSAASGFCVCTRNVTYGQKRKTKIYAQGSVLNAGKQERSQCFACAFWKRERRREPSPPAISASGSGGCRTTDFVALRGEIDNRVAVAGAEIH